MPLSATVREIAGLVAGGIEGPEDLLITGFGMLDEAGEGDLAFIGDAQHAKRWATAHATAALVSHDLELGEWSQSTRAVVRVKSADHAMIQVLEHFAPQVSLPVAGVHPTAIVDATVSLGADVSVGAYAIIDQGCTIGDRTMIESGARLHSAVQIGDDCRVYSHVVLYERTCLGNRVVVHAGAVIGADGFGFRAALDGSGILKVPHVGNAVLEDDVEIGANTCVDRAKFGSTTIAAGTKIDNLCQIGHNCHIGRCCMISGVTGIGGSSTIGDGTLIGGCCAVADHITIGKGARILGRTGVIHDVPDGETWAGFPGRDAKAVWREHSMLRKLPSWSKKLKELLDE
jgi:UDP-3-O-[3-hydroxymyristoyl] glucosamine N-acyltransferase